MLSLYEILKASKTGIAPDMWTALAGKNWGGAGHEVKELTGIPPLSFTADGTPLLDYLISGNMSQTGTPTPSNPVDVNGVGERTENLFDYNTVAIGKYIDANGNEASSSGTGEQILNHSVYIKVNAGTTYTFKCAKTAYETSYSNAFCWFDSSKQLISRDVLNVGTGDTVLITATAPTGTAYLIMNYRGLHGDTAMLNTGSTAKPYEPYGYKIPFSSGQQTTNIYLGSTQTVRKIKKYEITGNEDWENVAGTITNPPYFRLPIGAENSIIAEMIISSHYEQIFISSYNSNNGIGIANSSVANSAILKIRDTNTFTDVPTLKTYLQQQYANGTPVTVWYVLATPETAAVNEPLMKIGDYADTVSYEQAGVSIPTLNGQTVVDVETTLKPSKMYIKYKE